MFPNKNALFHPLKVTTEMVLPEQFTFPFYYEPHELSINAARQVQAYLESQTDFNHNFGLNANEEGLPIGKMFGVMIVQDETGTIGYLAAFSGKLAERNDISGFVPPLYNNLDKEGFYKKGEAHLNKLNSDIEALESNPEIEFLKSQLESAKSQFDNNLKAFKIKIKEEKAIRKQKREEAKQTLTLPEFEALNKDLSQQSIYYHFRLRDLKREGEEHIKQAEVSLDKLLQPIKALKEERKTLSNTLQKQLHQQYRFLNANGETKDLLDVFENTKLPQPPAGSGECAAPKLFQYAYKNSLKPIAMAEFWWGISPKSQVRKHKQFYPSCRGKCEPILGHMMTGLNVEENPITKVINFDQQLDIIYEDDYLLLVNKPHEFLSVPGIHIEDSVLTRMKAYLPNATGPLLLHRLDMSTSGLLLVAKNARTHKKLQKQFIDRTVKKRYIAILDGEINRDQGIIDLPLRVDLDHRPQQLVCYDHGKPATTKFKVISINNNKTRIHFYPVTGRTHQLRVHAAHTNGLKTPIFGDDLYGTKADRLYLHAESLTFMHPVTKKMVTFTADVSF
ncbi:pseudouridine synthase [Ichthyenterobacterium sp. W332]|uniref:Pseudouridine synthase n=1 Tax=Microcosmobacter mediterraneus TaxID=3075607 RepID=A0ABU2YIE5_9FLAO|nr:pseudouridine synthase [Ichthyenterobacterium sp. W332]MDT0557567.1 pseudouridine synthase [Ichthyenterobacterium sp. W332]